MVTHSPASGGPNGSITSLLIDVREGKQGAEARLISEIYDDLRRVARRQMRHERPDHTLQPTALVHEAYCRLVRDSHMDWQNRAHFFATAAKAMRHILVDHARSRRADKRGGVQRQVTLDDHNLQTELPGIDVLALDEALRRLTTFDERKSRIIELHFFGGLSFEEIALVLQLSVRTVKGDWAFTRAWLKRELSSQP
jgi:RNA polymerase sigma factor (TIGR02999 family)